LPTLLSLFLILTPPSSRAQVLIVTAKHGQSPIDPSLVKKLKPSVVSDAISAFLKDSSEPAQLTGDDSLLIWLKDDSRGIAVRDYLNANKVMEKAF
jgi:hypothetical protein